jgi:hypothetical protein
MIAGLGARHIDGWDGRRSKTRCSQRSYNYWRRNGLSGECLHPQLLKSGRCTYFAQGDIVFCEPLEGIVVIPLQLLDAVLDLMPRLVAADDKVKEDVLHGSTVFDAFKKHRS